MAYCAAPDAPWESLATTTWASQRSVGLRGALVAQFDGVADRNDLEELLDVPVAHPDAAVRGVAADRGGSVGAVDAVALAAEADPTGTERVGFSRRNDAALVIPGGIRDVVDDREIDLPGWATRARRRRWDRSSGTRSSSITASLRSGC